MPELSFKIFFRLKVNFLGFYIRFQLLLGSTCTPFPDAKRTSSEQFLNTHYFVVFLLFVCFICCICFLFLLIVNILRLNIHNQNILNHGLFC